MPFAPTHHSRIRIYDDTSGVVGGGPAPTVGSVAWGPDFGDVSDGTTFTAKATAALANAALAGNVAAAATLALVDAALAAQVGVGATLDMGPVSADADLSAGVSVDQVTFDVVDMLPQQDTWLDQANGSTTHGADAELLCRQANITGNQAQNAYVAWDLTNLDGDADPAGGDFTFQVRRIGGLLNANLNYDVYTHPTQPFVETSATWDSDEPPPGTLLDSGQFPSLGTGSVSRTHSLSEADMQTALGNWVYFRFTGENGLGNTTQFGILSKEGATPPELSYSATLL